MHGKAKDHSPSDLSKDLDSLLSPGLAGLRVSGAVLLVARDAEILYERAFGLAQAYSVELSPLADPEPMTTAHLFDLGSLTKVFATTFGIMLLADGGALDLEDSVSRFLPVFASPEKAGITVRSLLDHSSGLPAWRPVYYHAGNRQAALRYIAGLPLDWPVGVARCYSDLGFMVLGAIVETVTGQRLDAFLGNRLYEPLGLKNTTFTPLAHGFSQIVATSHGNPYEQRMIREPALGFAGVERFEDFSGWRHHTLKGEVNDANAFHCFAGVAGHSGLFATARDLEVLARLLLGQGRHQGRQLISAATSSHFLTPDRFGHGLGWAMTPEVLHAPANLPPGSFGHLGFTGTSVHIIPALDASIILLTNRQHGGLLQSGQYPDLKKLRRAVVAEVLDRLGY